MFVARFFHRLGFASHDVVDLVQSVFLVALQKGGFSAGPAKPRTWLTAIAFKVAAAERRRRRRRPSDPLGAFDLVDERTPERSLEVSRGLERVQRCLAQLDMPHRAAFVLFEVEGMSGAEIAEALEIPLGTVYRRVHVARQRFSEAYERDKREERERGR